MKLPLFHTSSKFETLFKEMDTKYSKNEINVWEAIEDSIVSEILRTGEVLIENEELIEKVAQSEIGNEQKEDEINILKQKHME